MQYTLFAISPLPPKGWAQGDRAPKLFSVYEKEPGVEATKLYN